MTLGYLVACWHYMAAEVLTRPLHYRRAYCELGRPGPYALFCLLVVLLAPVLVPFHLRYR